MPFTYRKNDLSSTPDSYWSKQARSLDGKFAAQRTTPPRLSDAMATDSDRLRAEQSARQSQVASTPEHERLLKSLRLPPGSKFASSKEERINGTPE